MLGAFFTCSLLASVSGLNVVATAMRYRIRGPAAPASRSSLLVAEERIAPAPEVSDLARVEVVADAAGMPTPLSFDGLGVTVAGVAANLQRANITAPNALQRATFGPISSGRDAVIHAWTGSGKTLAFLLPLLQLLDASSREPQVLVLCPSRELAFQIVRVADMLLEGTTLGAAAVVGGANPNRQLEKIKKARPQLIVGTPGRVGELAFEWRKLKLQRIRHIVIDEVDDALRPPHLNHTLRLLESARDGRPLQLVFASATADTPPVRRAAAQLLADPLMLRLRPADGGDDTAGGGLRVAELPSTIRHGVYIVPPQKGLQAVRDLHHMKVRTTTLQPTRTRSHTLPHAPLAGILSRAVSRTSCEHAPPCAPTCSRTCNAHGRGLQKAAACARGACMCIRAATRLVSIGAPQPPRTCLAD